MRATSRWSLGCLGTLCSILLVSSAAWPIAAELTAATQGPVPEAGVAADPSDHSPEWWSELQRSIEASEYRVTWQDATPFPEVSAAYQGPNRAHGFRTYFTPEGVRVIPRNGDRPAWVLGLSFAGLGRGDDPEALSLPTLSVHENRAEYLRGNVTEEYRNGTGGLEQVFTLRSPPGVAADPAARTVESLTLAIALSGDLVPTFEAGGSSIDFSSNGSLRVLRYGSLRVVDARGTKLPARLVARASGGAPSIRIAIDDRNAVYPLTVDSLATSASWSAEGDQVLAHMGFSVAAAGDVNGDGFGDVIVGAERYDNGQVDEGRAFAYYGSASGLGAVPAWTAEGDQSLALFGSAVATAGDVNGDGYSDVLIGARLYDGGQIDEGAAFLFLGSASGLDRNGTRPSGSPSNADWRAEGDQPGSLAGTSVSTAGDVNGDGYFDVLVGAPGFIDLCINNRHISAIAVAFGYETTWESAGTGTAATASHHTTGRWDVDHRSSTAPWLFT